MNTKEDSPKRDISDKVPKLSYWNMLTVYVGSTLSKLDCQTHRVDPNPIRTIEIISYLVKTSFNIRVDRILLNTRVRDEVELRVTISAYERLAVYH